MVKTLACSRFIKWTPPAAVKAKKAIGKREKNNFSKIDLLLTKINITYRSPTNKISENQQCHAFSDPGII